MSAWIFCIALFTSDVSAVPCHLQCIEVHERPTTFMRRVLQSIKPWDRYEVISHSSGTETETGLTTITLEIVP